MKEVLNLQNDVLWELKRILPGQRNGAKRWFSSFSEVLGELGFEPCIVMPSIFRHSQKLMVVNLHVDDILVALKFVSDGKWLLQELRKRYRLQVEGPVPIGQTGTDEEI